MGALVAGGVGLATAQQQLVVAAVPLAPLVPLTAMLWARLLLPGTSQPVGTLTLINTVLGQGMFLIACSALPLLLPLLVLSGRHRRRVAGFLLRLGSRMIFAASPFIHWRQQAAADLPPGPWVLVSNHESVLDILTCFALRGRPRVQLAKPWVFRMPFLGWGARVGQMLPMSALSEGRVPEIPAGCDLVIFPEGTRSMVLGRFHSGALQAAEDLGRPLLAAVQHGSGQVLGRGAPWVRPGLFTTRLLLPPAFTDGSRAQRSAALRGWLAERLAEPPPVPGWIRLAQAWESAAQQGPLAHWRACSRAFRGAGSR